MIFAIVPIIIVPVTCVLDIFIFDLNSNYYGDALIIFCTLYRNAVFTYYLLSY